MSKRAGEQTTTTKLDPQTMAMRQEIFNRARGVANTPYTQYGGPTVAGANPLSGQATAGMQGAMQNYQNIADYGMNSGSPNMHFGSGLGFGGGFDTSPYSSAGATGAAALGGDQSAISRLMDPYQNQVINSLNGQYDKLRSQASLDTRDMATRGGAYRGDRAALLEGSRLGEIDQGQAGTVANLLSGGYQNMMNNANNAANLGLGGGQIGNQYSLGVGDQNLRGQGLGADYALGQGNLRLGGLNAANQANAGQLAASQGLAGQGDYLRNIQQQQYDDALARFNEQRGWGEHQLGVLSGATSGQPYGQTQSTPLYRNVGAGALGGAATGAQIGSVIPGVGTAIGAGIGGLMGLF